MTGNHEAGGNGVSDPGQVRHGASELRLHHKLKELREAALVRYTQAKADIQDQVPESNEGNNERTEQIIVMPGPVLRASPNALSFGYSPTQQTFSIWNSGGGLLNYSVDANRPWLGVSPGSGTCVAGETNQTIVTIDVSGLLIGTNTGLVTISSAVGTSNVPATVIITDDDHDLIPDGWEKQYFGSAANCNPLLDPDGDGQSAQW
ncbi:MAG: hypothetical protein NT154_33860 [Verrucomicrobia bacterium]|nr:hypothetical protein [Verrucomicrobiota bacterium]